MVDNTQRELHGALLDAEILADVYLMMTGGQSSLSLGGLEDNDQQVAGMELQKLSGTRKPLNIIRANDEELAAHEARLKEIDDKAEQGCLWLQS
jgi:DNA polymerase-3 subunit epsilon